MIVKSPRELAMHIINQRKKQKLTQANVGDLVGLKQTTISAFENKPDNSQLDTMFRILSAVNLDIRIVPKNKSETNNNTIEW